MRNKQVLVTGAGGFIGHHLCRQLLNENISVIALEHSGSSGRLNTLAGSAQFTVLKGDITKPEFLSKLFQKHKIDSVFHLAIAPPSGVADQKRFFDLRNTPEYRTNFLGTLNLLYAALEQGAKHWIQSSTMSVYDFNHPEYLPVDEKHPENPVEAYGFSKMLADRACRYFSNIYGLKLAILRYSGVFGTGKERGLIAKFTGKCLENSSETFEASRNRTSDFVFVEDVVKANILALRYLESEPDISREIKTRENSVKSPVFHIGSGQEASVLEIAKGIKKITESNIEIQEVVSDIPRRFYFDITKAQKVLGYQPYSLREALRKYIPELTAKSPGN